MKLLQDLAPGTYYWPLDWFEPRALGATLSERQRVEGWQIRADTYSGSTYGDNGTWWSFTVSGPPAGASAAMATTRPSGGRRPGGPMGPTVALVALGLGAGLLRRRAGRPRSAARGAAWARVAVSVLVLLTMLGGVASGQAPVRLEFYHVDALGSVRLITDEQGQVVREVDYEPFGGEVTPATTPQANTRLFTGQQRDRETGLDYFGARYYRADLGRFTTVDPELRVKEALVDPQKWNRYAYVSNNPLRYVDPNGRWGIDVHFYLTYFLAGASGYSNDRAYGIAAADLGVDIKHDPFDPSIDERRKWHFPDLARQAAIGEVLTSEAGVDDTTFGEALHVFQDSSSHAGFAPWKGHAAESLFRLADPDNTSKNIDKAMTMAHDGYTYLVGNSGREREALPWSKVEPYVRRYLEAGSAKDKERRFYEMKQFLTREQQ